MKIPVDSATISHRFLWPLCDASKESNPAYLHSPKAKLCTEGKCKSIWPLQVNSWQDWSI